MDTNGGEPFAPFDTDELGKADVWGIDDRTEPDTGTSSVRGMAAASAMLADDWWFVPEYDRQGQHVSYRVGPLQSLQEVENLCDGERFGDQPVIGSCSATLVAPDLVATSGHCIVHEGGSAAQARCAGLKIVFDFAMTESSPSVDRLHRDSVYSCQRVEALEWYRYPENADWALIRLDRPVVGRTPAPVLGRMPDEGSALMQIGHPSGIPQKLAPGHATRGYEGWPGFAGNTFAYTSDIFGGNSGGGVFDLGTGTLAGIPTAYSGQNYVWDANRGCMVTGVCGVNARCDGPPGGYATAKLVERLHLIAPWLLTELSVVGGESGQAPRCDFRCQDFNYTEGMCFNNWQCQRGCLVNNGCSVAIAPPPTCDFRCVDFRYREGQCYQGWYCQNGCLSQARCF